MNNNNNNDNPNYDVVTDVLTKHKEQLNKMIQSNAQMNLLNIMDDIREYQIQEIDECLSLWKEYKEKYHIFITN
jgi:uncharacterized protein (UPF0254 family)